MECHSIQFTTISINVERGIVKILFKYRYFQDLLIDIDIDIDIFQNHNIDIDIDIFELPYQYRYRYRRLTEETILYFHFDYLITSLKRVGNSHS